MVRDVLPPAELQLPPLGSEARPATGTGRFSPVRRPPRVGSSPGSNAPTSSTSRSTASSTRRCPMERCWCCPRTRTVATRFRPPSCKQSGSPGVPSCLPRSLPCRHAQSASRRALESPRDLRPFGRTRGLCLPSGSPGPRGRRVLPRNHRSPDAGEVPAVALRNERLEWLKTGKVWSEMWCCSTRGSRCCDRDCSERAWSGSSRHWLRDAGAAARLEASTGRHRDPLRRGLAGAPRRPPSGHDRQGLGSGAQSRAGVLVPEVLRRSKTERCLRGWVPHRRFQDRDPLHRGSITGVPPQWTDQLDLPEPPGVPDDWFTFFTTLRKARYVKPGGILCRNRADCGRSPDVPPPDVAGAASSGGGALLSGLFPGEPSERYAQVTQARPVATDAAPGATQANGKVIAATAQNLCKAIELLEAVSLLAAGVLSLVAGASTICALRPPEVLPPPAVYGAWRADTEDVCPPDRVRTSKLPAELGPPAQLGATVDSSPECESQGCWAWAGWGDRRRLSGAAARLEVHLPSVTAGGHSSAEVVVRGGPGFSDVLEIGWTVAPRRHPDGQPHLLVQRWVDGQPCEGPCAASGPGAVPTPLE